MIKVKVPFRGQSVIEPIKWIEAQGLVFRRDWVWDSSNSDKDNMYYLFTFFSDNHAKIASSFILRWL